MLGKRLNNKIEKIPKRIQKPERERGRKKCYSVSGKKAWQGIGFILPSFIGILAFSLIPYLDVVRRSFTFSVTGSFSGFQNFKTVLENEAFVCAAKNTFRLIIVCVPILVILSLLIAVLLKGLMFGNIIKTAFLFPMAIPVASVVLLWKAFFNSGGFLNGFLHLFGFEGMDWMNTRYAFCVLVFSYIWKNMGYSVVLWVAGLAAIPQEIYDAASVDGAGNIDCFFRITVPNLLPAFFTITVLSLINSFKVFREAYLIAGDYPDKSIYMLQHIFNNWFRDLSIDKMAAGAVLNGAVLFVFIWLFWRGWGRERD